MKQKGKIFPRLMAVFLLAVTLLGMLPLGAFAADMEDLPDAATDPTTVLETTDTPTDPEAPEETGIPTDLPAQENAEASTAATEADETAAEPASETTAPTEAPLDPPEDLTDPSADATEPTGDAENPTEDTAEPTENTEKPAEDVADFRATTADGTVTAVVNGSMESADASDFTVSKFDVTDDMLDEMVMALYEDTGNTYGILSAVGVHAGFSSGSVQGALTLDLTLPDDALSAQDYFYVFQIVSDEMRIPTGVHVSQDSEAGTINVSVPLAELGADNGKIIIANVEPISLAGGSSGSTTGPGGAVGGLTPGKGENTDQCAVGVTMQVVYYKYKDCWNRVNSYECVRDTLLNIDNNPHPARDEDGNVLSNTVLDGYTYFQDNTFTSLGANYQVSRTWYYNLDSSKFVEKDTDIYNFLNRIIFGSQYGAWDKTSVGTDTALYTQVLKLLGTPEDKITNYINSFTDQFNVEEDGETLIPTIIWGWWGTETLLGTGTIYATSGSILSTCDGNPTGTHAASDKFLKTSYASVDALRSAIHCYWCPGSSSCMTCNMLLNINHHCAGYAGSTVVGNASLYGTGFVNFINADGVDANNGKHYYFRGYWTPYGEVEETVEPEELSFSLQKSIDATADCIAQIQDNPMYSLSGAKYDVYVNGVKKETLTTNASGKATSAQKYEVGTEITVKETVAPKGFKLDTAEHKFTITSGTNTFSVKDEPIFDPPFALTKVDKDTTTPQGNASFSGAIFKWEYFANDSWSGTAARTWYFQTNANGLSRYDPAFAASGYTSDELYKAADGFYQIPLGTVKITEIKNSLGYIVLSDSLYCSIVEDETLGAKTEWAEESREIIMDVANGDYGVYEPIDPALAGSLVLDKVDVSIGKTPQGAGTLANAKYQVINRSANSVKIGDFAVAEPGQVCYEFTTDANGHFESGAIFPLGTYTVKEAEPSAGYTLNTTWFETFTVTESGSKNFEITCPEDPIKGGIKIIKVDEEYGSNTGKDAKLDGITFSVINNSANPVVVNGTTYRKGATVLTLAIKWDGSQWSASSGNVLPYGSYIVKENPMSSGSDMANAYYKLNNQAKTVTVSANGSTVSVTYANTPGKGNVKIVKTTNTGKELNGWRFGIYTDAACTKPISGSPFTSGSDGTITANSLRPGTYYVKELDRGSMAISDWIVDTTVKTVVVEVDKTASVTFSNTKLGGVKMIKTTNTGKELNGWRFGVYTDAACTKPISGSPFTSDSDGTILTGRTLKPGTYYVKELDRGSTDISYWVIDKEVKTVTVKAGEDAAVTFSNTHMGKVIITKETNTGENLDDWQFTIYSDANCNNPVKVLTSEANGVTWTYIEPGTYWVKETGDTKGRFTNEYWKPDTTVQKIVVEAGKDAKVTFKNTHYGKIELTKIVPEDYSPEGWEFQIIRLSDNTSMGTFKTDKNGKFTTENLLPGVYQVKELIPEDSLYYCKTENPVTVTVKAGETAKVSFTNAFRPGRIEIKKVNTAGEPLAGAKFLLEWSKDGTTWKPVTYSDKEDVVKGGCSTAGLKDGCLVTDKTGVIAFENLHPDAKYRVTELEAPEGYVLLTDYAYVGGLPVDTLEVNLNVVNAHGYKLPESGVTNTGFLTTIGAFMAVFGTALAMLFVFSNYTNVFNNKKYAMNKKHNRKDM